MVFTLGSFVLVTVAVAFVSWLKTKGTDETSKDGYFLWRPKPERSGYLLVL